MESLETLLPNADKIKRWKVRNTSSRVKVFLELNSGAIYEPERLKKILAYTKIPIDNIQDIRDFFGNSHGKRFSGCSDELGSYILKLYNGAKDLRLKISKKIVPGSAPRKIIPPGSSTPIKAGGYQPKPEDKPLTEGYQHKPKVSEEDKFGRIPDLLKVVRDYAALNKGEEINGRI
jgi:hypothetical protein